MKCSFLRERSLQAAGSTKLRTARQMDFRLHLKQEEFEEGDIMAMPRWSQVAAYAASKLAAAGLVFFGFLVIDGRCTNRIRSHNNL